MLVNLVLLAACTALLCRLPAGAASYHPLSIAVTAVLMLAWSPTQSAVYAGQFSILVTVCLLLAFRCQDRHEYLAGAWLGLALIKPSMALPFLIFPLVRGRWRVLAVAVGLHLAATGVQAARFGCAPWELLRQWTGVAAYFAQGQFTLQELLSALRLAETPTVFAVLAGFVLIALAWCLANRGARDAPLIDLLCFVSVLWTYHGPYDFVVLLIPLARRCVPSNISAAYRPGWWLGTLPAFTLFACVSMAASPLVYGDEIHLAARLVRHGARLLLALGFVGLAADVWLSARAEKVIASLRHLRWGTVSRPRPAATRAGAWSPDHAPRLTAGLPRLGEVSRPRSEADSMAPPPLQALALGRGLPTTPPG
jgi:hypothetical protein